MPESIQSILLPALDAEGNPGPRPDGEPDD